MEGAVTNASEFQFQEVRSHPIPWDSCIRTGSLEGPPLWNARCISMFGPVFLNWERLGKGLVLSAEAGGICVSHFVWADN
eukprot:445036-Pyramimonas_sp.AAC.1